MVKNPPAKQEVWVPSLGQEDTLEKEWQPTSVFCLGKPKDKEAWQATDHGVTKDLAINQQQQQNSKRHRHLNAHSSTAYDSQDIETT